MSSLTLKGITKRFGNVIALSGVDLKVDDREFCVLLGPSGCGKSTLLNIIAGLIPQNEGSVIVDGQSIDPLSPRDRDIAMVFQSYALYPHMTVEQNLNFGLRMRKLPRGDIQKRVAEAAKLLGIEDLLTRKPRELSGGQRQRVAMGRALVRRPKLFLLDEPLSNLDARLRTSVRLELKRLHRQIQSTIIYVTHDQVEAMTLGDKVVVMRDGAIHQAGEPDRIYSSPADTFVAKFIGSPEINLYRGQLVKKGGRFLFSGRGFSIDLGELPRDIGEGSIEIGLRPEDTEIGEGRGGGLRTKVEMISHVGSEKYIHVRLGEEPMTVRTSRYMVMKPGDEISVTVDPVRLHLFREGRRISAF